MDGSSMQDTQDAGITPGVDREAETRGPGRTIDIARIMHAIPHRYPMLLIDRVVELHRNQSCIGVKNITVNENFFQGHFPGHPVMPAVLIIESMAQTAAILVVETLGDEVAGRVVYFMSVESGKFRRPVVPGDQLRIHCTKLRHRAAVAKVDEVAVAEATFTAMIMDQPAG
jgi:3-hydroxyacyl-[acyl-carrier-protein] dehydratase